MTGYELFIEKLDAFIHRFYRNKVFKGLFIFLSALIAVFLLFSTIEYFSFLSVSVRQILFWIFILLFAAGFFIFVFFPFGQAKGWFKRMSYREAAQYIASRYPELDDKLCNVLDLHEGTGNPDVPPALLDAAIEQISSRFISYRFEKLIRFRSVRKYVFLFLGIGLFLVSVWIANPRILGSSERIVRYRQHFEREFPFSIKIANEDLHVPFEADFTLELEVKGSHLPTEIRLRQGERILSCKRISPNRFTYTFKKVQRNIPFFVESGKYISGEYLIEVDYKPLISAMKIVLHYPSYMGKKPEVLDHSLDLSVPFGTKVNWELRVDHARDLKVAFRERGGNEEKTRWSEKDFAEVETSDRPLFTFSRQIFSSADYFILPEAYAALPTDTLSFFIESVPDAFPRIEALQFIDSNRVSRRYFSGRIGDDYGFHSLIFRMNGTNSRTGGEWTFLDTLAVQASVPNQTFTYYFDLEDFSLEPGDDLTYGFEVRDNDVFHAYKPAYSTTFSYRKLSQEEIREEVSRTSVSIDNQFSISLKAAKDFGKEVQDMIRDLLAKKQLGWQDRKNVELLIEQQKQLRQTYEKLSEELRQKEMLEDELYPMSEELKEKQAQLQELLNQLFDDSTMQKLQELQELMQKNAPREKVMDALEEVRYQKDLLQDDIERNLNLYRQVEFENRLQQAVSDAERLREQSKALTEEMKNMKSGEMEQRADSLRSSQQALESGREQLQKDLNAIDALNRSLEKPNSFSVPDSLLEAIRESIRNTESSLDKKENAEAKESQQNTDDLLQQLSDELNDQMERIEEENAAEDAAFIRFLLKSIIRVSVQQESLMDDLGRTKVNDPRYSGLIRQQSALNMEIRFVADSIRAISGRQPQVAVVTQKEVKNILDYSKESLDYLLGMNNVYYQRYNTTNSWALTRQQYTMTSLNNLALLLSESLDKMQQKMSMKGNGSSSKKQKGAPQMACPKPGGKKPSSGMKIPSMENSSEKDGKPSLQKMQQDLNRQIESLQKMLQEKQGKGMPQEEPGSSESKLGPSGNSSGSRVSDEQISESFARAAAQQEMIRRRLQEKMQQEKGGNPRVRGLYNQILGEMERTEKDLVNKVLTNQVLSRQKNIESRLLEAENAELKREQDDKRESRAGQIFTPFENDSLDDFLRKKMRGDDLLRSVFPELRPYYKKKVQDFFFKSDEE